MTEEEPPTTNLTGLTWDEFLALPYETRNASLINGEVVVNSPNAQHESILRQLILALGAWRDDDARRGEMITQQPVKATDNRGYQPDLAWYPPEQCSAPDEPLTVSGYPALIVEVLSPSTRSFDLLRKRADYERLGIAEVWFVDPEAREVLALRLGPDGTRPYRDTDLNEKDVLTSPLLEGFSVAVADLFSRRQPRTGDELS